MKINSETIALTIASGALGIVAAFTLSMPTALAEPDPVLPIVPAPAPAPADPATPAPAPPPGPVQDGTIQSSAGTLPAPPDGVPHLSSPENLPPGTTETPPPQGGGSDRRDLWHAYQTQEISGRDVLLLLAQRPMNPAAPPAGMPANPTPPQGPADAPPPGPSSAPPPLLPGLPPPPAPAP